jgi:2-dehydropantoate 2-reductase
MVSEPRILIAGCGAIGSAFGCLLREAGHQVTLLGRAWHLNAIRSGGLQMDGIWGAHQAAGFQLATHMGDVTGRYDLIIISVKAYDTARIAESAFPFINDAGLVLSAQNGLGNIETLAQVFGPQRSLGANVLVGAKIPEPGRVTITVQAAPIIIGPLQVSAGLMTEAVHAWARHFQAAHISCETTTHILSHLWAKVFYNAPLNALGALLRVPYGPLGDDVELCTLMNRIIDEAFMVAGGIGIEPLWETADDYRRLFYDHLLPSTYNHESSMLQDLQHGRRTEIDAINGQIWRYGQTVRIPTPFNEIMTRLIWEREKHLARHSGASTSP